MGDVISRSKSVEKLHVLAGLNDRGEEVLDELTVVPLPDRTFRLTQTPPLAMGLAAGDLVRVDPNSHQFEVLEHGGNLAVLVTAPQEMEGRVRRDLGEQLRAIGGSLDDYVRGELAVFTVPVAPGFPAIEAILNTFAESRPGVAWYYANVYDPVTDEPLRWWEASRQDV